MIKNLKKSQSGLTLIELIIVIAIIGILSVIGITAFFSFREQAVLKVIESNQRAVVQQLQISSIEKSLNIEVGEDWRKNLTDIKERLNPTEKSGSRDFIIKNPVNGSDEIRTTNNIGGTAAAFIAVRTTHSMDQAINNPSRDLWPLRSTASNKDDFIGAVIIQAQSDGYLIYGYPKEGEVHNIIKLPLK